MRVGMLDYGAGNLHSLSKAIERFDVTAVVSTDWQELLDCDALVLPGVGAFGAAVAALPDNVARVREALRAGHPCLGICLGMQLLFDSSDEAHGQGLGVIEGTVRRLQANTVPHIGWNDVEVAPGVDDPVLGSADRSLVAYFANSYVCHPADSACVLATSQVDGVTFTSAVRRGRTWGVQFHPEKSSNPGLRLIEGFIKEVRT